MPKNSDTTATAIETSQEVKLSTIRKAHTRQEILMLTVSSLPRRFWKKGRVVSLEEVHSLYGLQVDNKRYANLLKGRINAKFNKQIIILLQQNRSGPEYIASNDISKKSSQHRIDTIQTAASYLREDISTYVENLKKIVWPTMIEQLSADERKPPKSVRSFFETVLKQDLVHGVTKGKTIMEKHFLIGLGVHNLTGQRNAVEILNKLGHSVS